MNPRAPVGNPKTFHHCVSIYHFLRSRYKLKKPEFMNLMLEENSPSSEHFCNLIVNSMMDSSQDFPESRCAYSSSFDISTDTTFDVPPEKKHMSIQ